MAHLEIAFLTGDVERRELSKQQPLSIGNHKSNDVCIDEPEVELMHCRISWNKSAFEAVAAGVEPLDINGNLVQRATLKSGDVLRIGSVDFKFRTGDDAQSAAQGDEALALKPVTGELPTFLSEPDPPSTKPSRAAGGAAKSAKTAVASAPSARKGRPIEEDQTIEANLDDVLADEAEADAAEEEEAAPADGDWMSALAAESRVDVPARRSMPDRQGGAADADEETRAPQEAAAESESAAEEPAESLPDRLRQAMRHQQHRPGEEDTLRSPLVLMLGGGSAVLVLLAVTFYMIAGRQTTQAAFDQAKALYDEQKFQAAIPALEEFAAYHPKDSLAEEAKRLADIARIDQQIVGGAPNWEKGVEALRNFISLHIRDNRDDEKIGEMQEQVRRRAQDIALGAARSAGRPPYDDKLLAISDEANTIFKTYQPKDNPAQATIDEILATRRKSADAILRNNVFLKGIADVDAALEQKQPMTALELRRALLVRYPDFANERDKSSKLADRLAKTLETERGLVQSEDLDRPGEREERPSEAAGIVSLVFHARSRTDEVSLGQAVCAIGKDCCYGIDTVTSQPVWRRVIGADAPFFPIRESSTPSVILFDTRHKELVRVHQNTGELIWRQPIGEDAYGQPLIDEGQIYLPTLGGSLFRVDLATGSIANRLTFSQEITGPVALADGQHLVVAGDREVVYTLTKRPLACVGVSFLAQKPRSINAPLLSMGPYVLMIENGDTERSRLRLLAAANPLQLTEVATGDVEGLVLDEPVIRGRDLFIPSTRERVTAFTVSDDQGQPPLLKGPSYLVEGAQDSPIFLTTGPDRQLWMASSALRRLQLTNTALEADQQVVALGLASQPLQYFGGVMFNARRRPYTDAVTFTQTNRDELTSAWQAVLGARIIAWSTTETPAPALVCATEAGHAFRVNEANWRQGGFYVEGSVGLTRLPLNEQLMQPLVAAGLPDGQVAVAAGAPEPRVWVLTKQGTVDRTYTPDAPLQAPPAALGTRLVFPIPGKLQVSSTAGQPQIQEFALPSDQAESVQWRQLLSVDANNLIALTEAGQALQIRLQTSPRAHLAEVSRLELGAPVDVGGDVAGGMFALADGERVRVFDAATMDARAERTLGDPVSNDVWLVGELLFVELAGDRCECLDPADGLKSRWPQPLDLGGAGLAGRPLVLADRVLVTQVDGTASSLDLATGQLRTRINIGSALTSGPVKVGPEVFAATLDGSLVKLTPLTQDN